jgi:signal peptidase I
MLQFFNTTAISNYPTLKKKQLFFTSNLIKPKRFDFVAYNVATPDIGPHMRVYRVCGIAGDKIEIKNGVLFVNEKNGDEGLVLAHAYTITSTDFSKLNNAGELDTTSIHWDSPDSLTTYISDKLIVAHNIKASRMIIPVDFVDDEIKNRFHKSWNQDNFGPVFVPKNKYFLLGDNRLYAQDSRYLGFVDEKDVVGTVLGVR